MYALHFTHPGPFFLQDPPGAVGSFSAPGDPVNRPPRSGMDMCEHGTPHRKAREIAHLSTVHSGEDFPPRANSTPCENRTHDLLAVRRQCKLCKQLSHRATSVDQFPQGMEVHKIQKLKLPQLSR